MKKKKMKERIPHMCESIGHRPLRGRRPKRTDGKKETSTNKRSLVWKLHCQKLKQPQLLPPAALTTPMLLLTPALSKSETTSVVVVNSSVDNSHVVNSCNVKKSNNLCCCCCCCCCYLQRCYLWRCYIRHWCWR